MSFTSPVFFIFLPVVLLLYRFLPKRGRLPLLLAASYLFYAYYDVRLLGLILLTTVVSYLAARKHSIRLCMVVCLLILFVFKYFNFTLQGLFGICNLFGASISFSGFSILLPMGISFYVFQTMSYTFDVHRGTIEAEQNYWYYSLFVVFFPQLVAGPIERPADLLPQLKASPTPTKADMAEGFCLFLRGYAKKLLIADYVAVFVNTAYGAVETAGGAALGIATLLFAIQIYCDFSGYSDIALGCARFMGIHLSENFRRPYLATSIRDFWKRWHISLTRWFTDYLYIPLGGNRKGLFRQCCNTLITFFVSGLWHGANITYVIWGGLHGFYLVVETLLFRRKRNSPKSNKTTWFQVAVQRLLTFLLVCFAWIFFRASTLQDAFTVIRSIFTDFRLAQLMSGLNIRPEEILVILLLIILLPCLEKLPRPRETRTILTYFLLILTLVICRSMILIGQGSTSFIYFQF